MPAPTLSPRARGLLIAIAALYAAVAVASGIHRGEDIENHLQLADRLLRGDNFYVPRPPFGTWWLPAAIGLLTPFAGLARVSLPLAKACFGLLCVALLYWTVIRTPTSDWRRVAIALVAVAGPLQFDFRYLNISIVLLAVIAAGTRDLESGRELRAGVWFGLATALKLFPGLLLAYLLLRRRWRGALAGAAIAAVLTALPLLALGPVEAIATARSWIELSTAGFPVRRLGNQSLPQLIERLGGPAQIALLLRLAIVALTAWALARPREIWAEVALVTLAAVLLSPIAWWYYFVLAYPAWTVVVDRHGLPATRRRVLALGVTGLLMCGVLGPRAAGIPIISAGVFTWAALSLFVLLVSMWRKPVTQPVAAAAGAAV